MKDISNAENEICIVIVCDNHFVTMLAALLKSIEINCTSTNSITIFIVDDKINAQNKQKLQSNFKTNKLNLIWLDMYSILPKDVKLPLDSSTFPLNIYIRLFIPYFIPEQIKKVLYLDVDTIVLRDLSHLWEINLNNNIIGAVVDRSGVVSSPWGGIKNYKELGLAPDTKYLNAGIFLINTVLWRNEKVTERVMKCITDNIKDTTFPDQYGLNVVLANRWLELNPKWNCYSISSEKDPYIIHFIGRKPIYKTYDSNEDYKKLFFHYLSLTPWKDYKPVSENKRLIKKLYNLTRKKIKKLFV